MQKIIVTGGLGYIGSHTVVLLQQAGFQVSIIDDLSNSSIEVLDKIKKISGVKPDFFLVDLQDKKQLDTVFSTHQFDGVILQHSRQLENLLKNLYFIIEITL